MLIHWIAVAILIIIGLYFLKIDHHTRKIKLVLIVIVGLIIYFSIMGVFKSEQVDVTNPRGIINAAYVYFGWIGQTISNLWDIGVDTVSLVGNTIKTNNTEDEPRR
jgi:hypothetical protein